MEMLSDIALDEERRSSQDIEGAVGYLSVYVPEEIIIAAGGRVPFRIYGTGKPAKLANAYLPKTFDPHVLDSLEGALDGSYKFLDGVVVANVSDAHRRLYDAWRLGVDSMEVFFLDVPKGADALRLKAFRLALSTLVRDMERAFAVKISEENLRSAIRLCNETRLLFRRLSDMRKESAPPFSAKRFFEVVRWSQTHDKHVVNDALRGYLEELKGAKGSVADGPRIMLTGSFMSSPELSSLMERLGARVVCEDLCTGMQYFSTLVDEDSRRQPLDALAERYLTIPTARMVDTESRWDYLLRTAEDFRVDGVVYFTLKFDDIYLFEYPHIRDKFQKAGYPVLFIEAENFWTSLGQIETRVQAFIEMLS
ncbi:MAG: 2-hydroxyacyl-CoA dehydratase family protein [Candidatus Brocadiales bacterium]|nr:2-hydroxyacyl-CoA dehydratase family protein [Candidatus Bathyanammoxibius amoris]